MAKHEHEAEDRGADTWLDSAFAEQADEAPRGMTHASKVAVAVAAALFAVIVFGVVAFVLTLASFAG